MMGNERLNQWIERNEKWKKYIAQGISRPTAVGHRPHSGPTRRTTPPKSPVARPRGPPRRVICIQYRTSRTHSADIFHPVCRTGFTAPIRTTTRGRRTTQISTSRTHNTTLPARPRAPTISISFTHGFIWSKRLSPSPRASARERTCVQHKNLNTDLSNCAARSHNPNSTRCKLARPPNQLPVPPPPPPPPPPPLPPPPPPPLSVGSSVIPNPGRLRSLSEIAPEPRDRGRCCDSCGDQPVM